jgi:hypothetical protein
MSHRSRTPALVGLLPLSAVLLSTLSACGGDAGPVSFEVSVTDSAGVQIVEYPGAAIDVEAPLALEDAPDLRIGVLDGDEARQFSRILGAHRTTDGHIVVVDGQGPPLRRFDSEGTLLHTAGSRGEGPGELSASRAVFPTADGGTRIWDQRAQRIVQIDGEGRILEDMRAITGEPGQSMHLAVPPTPIDDPPVRIVALMERTSSLPSGPESGAVVVSDAMLLLRTESDPTAGAASLDTLATFPGSEIELTVDSRGDGMVAIMMASPRFRAQFLAASTGEALWFSRGTRWEASRFGPEGLEAIVRIDGEITPLGPEFRDAVLDDLLDGVTSRDAEIRIREAHQERDWPETLPPIRALFADDAGRLWLGIGDPQPSFARGMGFGPGTERFIQDWLLLANDGTEVVGRLTLPPRTRPLYADEEGVLLEARDELDVPYIEWWRFRGR